MMTNLPKVKLFRNGTNEMNHERCLNCGLYILNDKQASTVNINDEELTGYIHANDTCPITDPLTRDAIQKLIFSNTHEHQTMISQIFKKLFKTRLPTTKHAVRCKTCRLVFYTSVRGNAATCTYCQTRQWVPTNVEDFYDREKGNESA